MFVIGSYKLLHRSFCMVLASVKVLMYRIQVVEYKMIQVIKVDIANTIQSENYAPTKRNAVWQAIFCMLRCLLLQMKTSYDHVTNIILRQGVPRWHMSEVHLDLAQHIPSHQMPWPQSLHSLVVHNLGWASVALAFHIDGCQSTQLTQSLFTVPFATGNSYGRGFWWLWPWVWLGCSSVAYSCPGDLSVAYSLSPSDTPSPERAH